MSQVQAYLMLFPIWLLSTIVIHRRIRARRATRGLPPSPEALPVIGHLHLLRPRLHQAFHKLFRQYGPLFHVSLGSIPCVVASSPEMAREILKTNEIYFSNRPQISTISYLTYDSQDFAFAPYGPYWRFMKKLCISQLLGTRTLDFLSSIRYDEVKNLVKTLKNKAEQGRAVDVRGLLMKLTNNVISRMIMSKSCSGADGDAVEVRKMIQEASELSGKFDLSEYFWFCKNFDMQGIKKRLKKVRSRFDEMMESIIKEREETRKKMKENKNGDDHEGAKDLLDMLLGISEDDNSEMRLTRVNIKAFVIDLFNGGSETSAISAEWALAEMINNPHIMKKAVKEIDSVVGKSRIVEESDIPKLTYLQAIFKETLRLHPPAPLIMRECTQDCSIRGYNIPAKTRVFINAWSIGKDPNYWQNPLEFRPERFLVSNEDGDQKLMIVELRGQQHHFLPFGSGRRGCPGISLASVVVQTALATMIQCFEWKVEGNGKLDMEEGQSVFLYRARPFICVPLARLDPFPSL